MESIKGIRIPIDPEEPMTEVTLTNKRDYFLGSMQDEVHGYIERVIIGDCKQEPPQRFNGLAMYVNEEGAIRGQLPNPRATILYGGPKHGGIIYGDVILVGEHMGPEGSEPGELPEEYNLAFFKEYFAREWLIDPHE